MSNPTPAAGPRAGDRYRLHGLDIRSEIPLFQHRPAERRADDLVMRWGPERSVELVRPPGALVAEAVVGEQLLYSLAESNAGYLLRCHACCDFAITEDVADVTCHPHRDALRTAIPILAAGTLLASLLMLRGHVVLHGTAVQIGERALAFVGRSGAGKSTLGALFAGRRMPLITDDVLRVDLERGHVRCRLGATEIRLRPAARPLGDQFATVRETGDGRAALAPPASVADHLPLAAIVVPLPSREATHVEVTVRKPREALMELARCPRVLGWTHARTAREQFELLAEIVGLVPVYNAVVPWGPPFSPRVVDDLAHMLGVDLDASVARAGTVPD